MLEGNGKYPFFTCSFETKKSYTYSYDFPALLVSSGGSKFHAKVFFGKFQASTDTFIVKLGTTDFIYLMLEFLNIIYLPQINWVTCATTFLKHLSPQKLKEIEILIPDQKILEKFNNFWKNIHSKIKKLELKMQKYEEIKKKLLDSLFSQEIQVY
ncbi:putative type I restriction-modification system specificity subunit [Mycoplasma suis str. Illinois]|uniref:Putative type I restriction-modification system specificity subunit n=1 Tax=Mycoplasma suis (strain Illinois) TaxID=768700 RepID=F0QRP3_MYCSL|nr:restriction endonuclease subunit S [Mycoplasma suis]ADX98163.1 putative type I restriction-modification system specificity subunit [Mycoplasma suis str. Illinois]